MGRHARIVVFTLFGCPASAWAHLVNQDVGEFYAGMLHPLTSFEHFLPAVVLGLLAGRKGLQGARWALLFFPAALILGTLFGSGILASPGLSQAANFALIVVLGLLLAAFRNLPLAAVIAGAATTGLILGWRSSMDMANAGVGFKFIPGVGLTGFLLMALISPWVAQGTSTGVRTTMRIAGGLAALAGVYLLGGSFGGEIGRLRAISLPTEDSLTALVRSESLSLPVMAGAFLASTVWGASHALTPGHGKAIVGAYLIGSRGTPLHALYLGLTVTATHTLGIMVLGLVALFASRFLLPEQLTPWLALASGMIVVVIGATLLYQRIVVARKNNRDTHHHTVHVHDDHEHHHNHDHTHGHEDHHEHPHGHDHHHAHHHSHLPPGADGAAVTWRSLLALGVSGGLLPCPAALVLLLTAISIGRTGLGILLVIAFSIGLAAVLTLVGMLFIKGSLLLRGTGAATPLRRYAPGFSALVIIVIGVFITAKAVSQLLE
jgi:ABC-type nickel/cobalt efflux system permease component RcnA